MKYAYFEPRLELGVELDDAQSAYHPGHCAPDVDELSRVPYIAEQLARVTPEQACAALEHYGAWSADELRDHDTNLQRILWLACADVVDNPEGEE